MYLMGSADQNPEKIQLKLQVRVLLLEFASLTILSGLLWQFGTREYANAALFGGLIAIVPFHYFVARAFRIQKAENVLLFKRSLSHGQVGRYLLTAALFVMVLKFNSSISPWFLFGGFGLTLLTQIVGTALVLANSESKERLL